MSPDHQRIVDLEDHLTRSTTLLKENEDELRLAATPRERAYYKREIERIRGAITEYREELDALGNDNVPAVEVDSLARKLDSLESKVDAVLTSVSTLKADLLVRFDESERIIIASVVDRLTAQELENTDRILCAIDEGQVSEHEMVEVIESVRVELSQLQEQLDNSAPRELVDETARASEVLSDPELSVKHKLKTGFPIIPFVLSYEGEIELGQSASLTRLWQRISSWWNQE